MAVSAIIAALSTGATVFTGGALFGGSILTTFLVRTAMGAALNALTPKAKTSGGGGSSGSSASGVGNPAEEASYYDYDSDVANYPAGNPWAVDEYEDPGYWT